MRGGTMTTTSAGTPSAATTPSITAAREALPLETLRASGSRRPPPAARCRCAGRARRRRPRSPCGSPGSLAHLLDLLRIQVAAGLDDEVLEPAGDEDLAVGAVAEVPLSSHPPSTRAGRRGSGLAEVALRHRGPAEVEPSPRRPPRRVQPRRRYAPRARATGEPHGDEAQGRGVVVRGGHRAAGALEGRRARRGSTRGAAARRREGERHGVLGQAVDRAQGPRPEAVGREAPGEALEVSGLTGSAPLRASARRRDRAPRSPRRGSVARTARRRSWARRRACHDARESSTASAPVGRGRQRRHQDERNAEVQATQPGADEAHVVVEGQPAHDDVGRAGCRAPTPMARMLASRLAWVSTTPFGLPVLPEVYWISAGSSGPAGIEEVDALPRPGRSRS